MTTATETPRKSGGRCRQAGNYGTLAEVAKTAGLTRWMAAKAAEAGEIRTTTVGGRLLYHLGDGRTIAERLAE
jgi:hypothetical protein